MVHGAEHIATFDDYSWFEVLLDRLIEGNSSQRPAHPCMYIQSVWDVLGTIGSSSVQLFDLIDLKWSHCIRLRSCDCYLWLIWFALIFFCFSFDFCSGCPKSLWFGFFHSIDLMWFTLISFISFDLLRVDVLWFDVIFLTWAGTIDFDMICFALKWSDLPQLDLIGCDLMWFNLIQRDWLWFDLFLFDFRSCPNHWFQSSRFFLPCSQDSSKAPSKLQSYLRISLVFHRSNRNPCPATIASTSAIQPRVYFFTPFRNHTTYSLSCSMPF